MLHSERPAILWFFAPLGRVWPPALVFSCLVTGGDGLTVLCQDMEDEGCQDKEKKEESGSWLRCGKPRFPLSDPRSSRTGWDTAYHSKREKEIWAPPRVYRLKSDGQGENTQFSHSAAMKEDWFSSLDFNVSNHKTEWWLRIKMYPWCYMSTVVGPDTGSQCLPDKINSFKLVLSTPGWVSSWPGCFWSPHTGKTSVSW